MLFRVDAFGEAADPVRKEKATFEKCHVAMGDLLVLKSNKNISMGERLSLHVNVTTTGFPDDCMFIGHLEASREFSLEELKRHILSMDYFQQREVDMDRIRVRDKLNTMFFGRIYRDKNKKQNLKQLGIKNDSQVVVQLLEEPEGELDERTFVLLFCRRQVEARTYSEKMEKKFTIPKEDKFPTIAHLKACCRELYGFGENQPVEIAKFIPHAFEWRHMDPEEMIEERTGKKKKQRQLVKAAFVDLKKYPWTLKDGDIIGCRLERDNPEKADDFQTDQDLIDKANFALQQEHRKQAEAATKALQQKDKRRAGDHQGLSINLEDSVDQQGY